MRQIQTITQKLSIESKWLTTIFPVVEDLLHELEYQKALLFVAASKDIQGRYISVMDFLFCEVLGSPWIHRCATFYKDEGLPLRKILNKEGIRKYQNILVISLKIALSRFQNRKASWTNFRCEVLKAG